MKLGELNTRMKDFFDIWLLAAHFAFGGRTLTAAVGATFNRRQTAIETAPICFSERFASDPSKAIQWKAFVNTGQFLECAREFFPSHGAGSDFPPARSYGNRRRSGTQRAMESRRPLVNRENIFDRDELCFAARLP